MDINYWLHQKEFILLNDLSNIVFHYNFTKEQKFSTDINKFKNTINQVELAQFNGENGGKKYVICFANNIIYFINENGKIIFYKELENKVEADYSITLAAYKYYSGEYYFVIAYNSIDVNYHNVKVLTFFYYKIIKENEIKFITKRMNQLGNEDLNLKCISCHSKFSSANIKSLVCFINGISRNSYYFNQDFQYVFTAEAPIFEKEFSAAKVIKSCINDEQTKALVCYSLEDNEVNVKCFYYNSQQNKLSEIFINVNYCNTNIYGFNIFFFQQSNEYIFSCVDITNAQFSMRRLDINFNLINDDDNNFLKRSFSDCYNYDFFSIIYISNYNAYSGIFNSNCISGIYIRIFMLSDKICKPQNENDENTISTSPETIIFETTKLETPILETTLPIPETAIPPIITTVHEVVITNTPTNEQEIITNSLKVESSVIDTTTIQNIKTTVLDIDKIENTEANLLEQATTTYLLNEKTEILKNTEFPIESLCEKNKIYSEGKCICNTEKGYYSINYKSSEKCYKKSELPKNIFFNNITKSYELCYKSCETCSKGGIYSENNCITCANNYILEPGTNSSNCVEDCKYLHYYNIFGQFCCTEDEQCPKDASLIIRSKEKCINKCSNDNTHIFQYNGECLSSCPDGT